MSRGGQRYDAMTVREYTDGQGQARTTWTKIGAGFTNQDGSISLVLDAMPLNGKVILQVPMTKEEKDAKWGNRQGSFGGGGGRGWGGGQRRGGGPQRGGFQAPPGPGRAGQRKAPEPPPDYPQDWDQHDEVANQEAAGATTEGFPDEGDGF